MTIYLPKRIPPKGTKSYRRYLAKEAVSAIEMELHAFHEEPLPDYVAESAVEIITRIIEREFR